MMGRDWSIASFLALGLALGACGDNELGKPDAAAAADSGLRDGQAADGGVDGTLPDGSVDAERSPAILVAPTTGLMTSESGDKARFTIVLGSVPTADVTVDLHSSDTTEGTVSPASVTFTSANFAVPQTITVTGVDDALADGNQLYSIVTDMARSGDARYAVIDPPDVVLTNADDETANVLVSPGVLSVTE